MSNQNMSSEKEAKSMQENIKKAGGLFYQYRPCRRDAETIYDKLRWYAVILYQWISGNGLSLIMQSAIKYKKDHPSSGVEVDRKIVKYDDSIKHRNIVISDTLNAIEDVILFRIANYFLRFSSEYKRFHNIDVLPNDWYEYVEYGTTNPLTIFLQRNGFSREASTYIKQHLEYITEVNGEYKVKTELLDCPSKSVCKEAAEIKYNIPELFIEETAENFV